ncbi:1-phosphatidylinositol-3-phosphate 5-kinase [Gigaspora margarita]|uniref:1-phosphatidylinositol-3-phosphate 5-kinase n=1 Tax=Gigaspora margarita TaxID=4874 RepID=A0A8H3XHU9_GIGMA|nr:1-phosphatidylinositol-3-phosphate 5-kinase [Gigaspora margarita]
MFTPIKQHIIPSHKPLPALPTEKEGSQEFTNKSKLISNNLPPVPQSNDLMLDSGSLGHIRKLLRQTLNNCNLANDPWESKDDGGKPTDSQFIFNHFEGIPLFKHELDEGLDPSKESKKRWVGGTIVLKGAKRNGVDKIIELMVFVVCNLKLELCLYRDHFIKRDGIDDIQDAEEVKNTLRSSRRHSKSSLFGWLMKHGNLQTYKELTNKSNEKRERREKNEKREKHEKRERRGSSSSLARWTSISRTSSLTKGSRSSVSIMDFDDDTIMLTKSNFSKVINQMETSILSVSPGVRFPPPHLLMKLKEEEANIHSTLDDINVDFTISTEKYRTYAPLFRSGHISLDFKTGLSYLMTQHNNTLKGVFKHQSISCSYARFWSPNSTVLCNNNEIITMDYYNKTNSHMDKSLGELIDEMCDKAYAMCENKTCEHRGIDHISTYTHNNGRISIIIEESPDLSLKAFAYQIVMWTQCKLCSAKSPVFIMSRSTYLYSFAKYLELLYYNEDFICKDLCPHVELRDQLLRCFRRGNFLVKIEYEYVDLFEMRLPKFQVSLDKQIASSIEDIENLFTIDNEDSQRLNNETRLEITYFYLSVKQHITSLEDYLRSLHIEQTNSNVEATISEKTINAIRSLEDLTKSFYDDEFKLYDMLKQTNATILNNVRRALVDQIKMAKKRMLQWQKENIVESDLDKFNEIKWTEPEYSSSDSCHVFPESPVITREDEPSSIIAFTLSSQGYLHELSMLRHDSKRLSSQSAPVTPVSEIHMPTPSASFSLLLGSLKNPSSTNISKHSVTNESDIDGDRDPSVDGYSIQTKRKVIDNGISEKITYGFESLGSIKPFNLSLTSRDKKKDSEKDVEKSALQRNVKFSNLFGSNNTDPEKVKDVGVENEKQTFNEKQEYDVIKEVKNVKPEINVSEAQNGLSEKDSKVKSDKPASLPWNRKNPKQKEQDSPHIKHKAIHGNKRITCTVYFAEQFDCLRRRCGIEDIYVDSLTRCSSWKVTGGKSASTFFKTQDDQLVIKQMVKSWTISEKEALLQFSPKYFEYMNKSSNKPSVLAKIFGFYSIKIKDLKKNNIIMKMDVLVMEQLFFQKTITRKFDLKGIQERHTKEQLDDATLWDGDWVDGRYKSRFLTYSYGKKLLREAIANDTQFLCDANIMDYSLLVGVDDDKKELVTGIVDFIGEYTFYKKIENRGKTLGRNAKEVTVLPPDQYKDRFRDSIEQYFLAIPDKWTKIYTDNNPQSPVTNEQKSPAGFTPPPSPISPISFAQSSTSFKLPSVL